MTGAVVRRNVPAPSITWERIAQLPPAQQPAWRDYLARSARLQAADRAALAAEVKAAGLAKPIIPAEGRGASSVPAREEPAYYHSAEAREIADIVVSFQTPAGGWSKNLDLSDHVRQRGEHYAPNNVSRYLGPDDFDTPHDRGWNYVGTFDNDATTTELRFLARVSAALGAEAGAKYRASFLKGLDYVFNAQFPNGGWPQVYPLEGGYHDAITYNDGAVIQTIELLRQTAAGRGDLAFVPESLRARAAASAQRGLGCLLATQIVAHGVKTVWCQQHDALTFAPESGRNYEPPDACAAESADLVMYLMSLPHPSPAIVASVDAAAAWFRRTAIRGWGWKMGPNGRRWTEVPGAGPIWARYYDSQTDRPIFGDRDKTLHDNVNELSAERRRGYQWFGTKPGEALQEYARWRKSL